MRCKKGPTLSITNLQPDSSVGVWVKENMEEKFVGKSCKRKGRNTINVRVPTNQEILIRVRKHGWLPFEITIKTADWCDSTVWAAQVKDNYIFTIHAQDCTGPSKIDRRTAGLRGRTEDAILYDESQTRIVSKSPATTTIRTTDVAV